VRVNYVEFREMLRILDYKKYFDGDDFCVPNAPSWYDPFLDLPDASAMFGCWVLILKTWSRCPGDGYLTADGKKDGKPLSAADFARLNYGGLKEFSRCLEVITSLGFVRNSDQFPLYQIVDYDEHFENNKSRVRNQCSFVCVPNKHGGTGLSNLLSEPDNLFIYGFWMLLLQLCSRQRSPRLGYVTADGKENGRRLGAAELARTFRVSAAQVRRCLQVLVSPEVGFMRLVDGKAESPESDGVWMDTSKARSVFNQGTECFEPAHRKKERKKERKERKKCSLSEFRET
jgi:hypothetical protein